MRPVTQRLFVALPTPEKVRIALVDWSQAWREGGRAWRWVQPEGLHVTLRFYGDVPVDDTPGLQDRIRAAAAEHGPFGLVVQGWGVFPGPARPRVVWAGLSGATDQLAALAHRIEQDARDLGFEPERRAFHPHVTLARARADRRAQLHGRPDPASPVFGDLPADAIVLYASHLGPAGARYEALLRAPLGGGRDDARV